MEEAISPHLQRIRSYYEETRLDYRVLWLNARSRGLHFGYWDGNTRGHADSVNNMNRVMAERLGIQPGQRVLDAGCGQGGSAVWLAREYDVEVVGITIVPHQVARARRYAMSEGVADRVRFEEQDYSRTSFPDASFDVVWAMESVCHAADKPRFLAEARRLLRPGGRLGIEDYLRFGRSYGERDEGLIQSWLSGWAIPDLATGYELVNWCVEAGFGDIDLVDITPHVRPSLRRLYRIARLLWPLALALRAVGLRSATQHGNSRAARDQYRALERGLWFEGMLTATAQ
jgi:tocopherol O-methyltransferase